ncbi:indolepyruvate ferredoxin oxidoreductase subunit alpha, partial [Treponema endosymbiont of Eucomonympha sp.]|uniref:indolepyruvate ferredoxin oxidoreductase subunit alpha n=1 Tax=Treponema endosymbiont of Eucomonympha sp. TaxID=1580831 RepID=UPI000AF19117
KYFREVYLTHIRDKNCPAKVCKPLISYEIRQDACSGCCACAKGCPVKAISGEKKKAHAIDAGICSRCGLCRETCKFNAIEVN